MAPRRSERSAARAVPHTTVWLPAELALPLHSSARGSGSEACSGCSGAVLSVPRCSRVQRMLCEHCSVWLRERRRGTVAGSQHDDRAAFCGDSTKQ
jgi:hypothetical protein